jgi:hypothetical protein
MRRKELSTQFHQSRSSFTASGGHKKQTAIFQKNMCGAANAGQFMGESSEKQSLDKF